MTKVSVIPEYNSARFIRQTIDSVLAQTYQDFEIIVVDDGSTDAAATDVSPIDDARIRYIRQENRRVAAAQNMGHRCASSQYIAFLGADDLFAPHKLADQVAVLD